MRDDNFIHFNVCIKANCPNLALLKCISHSIDTEHVVSNMNYPKQKTVICLKLNDGSDYYVSFMEELNYFDKVEKVLERAYKVKIPKCKLGEGVFGIVPIDCLYKLEHIVL